MCIKYTSFKIKNTLIENEMLSNNLYVYNYAFFYIKIPNKILFLKYINNL